MMPALVYLMTTFMGIQGCNPCTPPKQGPAGFPGPAGQSIGFPVYGELYLGDPPFTQLIDATPNYTVLSSLNTAGVSLNMLLTPPQITVQQTGVYMCSADATWEGSTGGLELLFTVGVNGTPMPNVIGGENTIAVGLGFKVSMTCRGIIQLNAGDIVTLLAQTQSTPDAVIFYSSNLHLWRIQ